MATQKMLETFEEKGLSTKSDTENYLKKFNGAIIRKSQLPSAG